MNKICILIGVLCLISCTPEGKLKRLLKKHPQLVKIDSVVVADTTIVPKVEHDTILSLERILGSKDTIIIRKERLTQKIYYRNDSVFISGECDTDTLIRYRTKYIHNVVSNNDPWRKALKSIKWYHWIWGSIIGLIIVLLLYKSISNKSS